MILEAGLEMYVSPRKKTNNNIVIRGTSASALSLVFAFLNPSICVLDEVDTPLDDANVTRFCALLDDTKITKTKFI